MKHTFIAILVLSSLAFGYYEIHATEEIKIRIEAKSPDQNNPVYMQTMEFGDNRTFIKGKDGVFNLSLEQDKVYSVYVGQRGMQTVLFNVNTHIEEIVSGNFNFSIAVTLNYKTTNQGKKVHDIEIISNDENKPALLFKKKN